LRRKTALPRQIKVAFQKHKTAASQAALSFGKCSIINQPMSLDNVVIIIIIIIIIIISMKFYSLQPTATNLIRNLWMLFKQLHKT
jgi:hypothetical protein